MESGHKVDTLNFLAGGFGEMVVALHIQCRLFHSLVMLMIVPLGCCDDFMIQSFLDVLEAVASVSSGRNVIVTKKIQTFGFSQTFFLQVE
jgi:hypothetical protein